MKVSEHYLRRRISPQSMNKIPASGGAMLRILSFILIMATLVVAIIFAVINYGKVPVRYFFGETHAPLAILLFGAFLFGLLFGLALDSWLRLRQRARIRMLEKEKAATEAELNNLRKMPIKDLS